MRVAVGAASMNAKKGNGKLGKSKFLKISNQGESGYVANFLTVKGWRVMCHTVRVHGSHTDGEAFTRNC